MNSNPSLPQDIIFDILSRLPLKSIGRSRCVSKPWLAMLSQPQFINAQLHRSKNLAQESLILLSCERNMFSAPLSNAHQVFDEITISAKMLNFSGMSRYSTHVYGSCDGLVLVVDGEEKISVLNPLTREIREVPHSLPRKRAIMYGFGYDSLNDDYKIVAFYYYGSRRRQQRRLFVNVHSLKKSIWKRVKSQPRGHVVGDGFVGVFANGCVHWLARDTTNYTMSIVAFDLVGETFNVVPLPILANNDNFGYGQLGVLGGCVCVFGEHATELWIMKEYGVHESWIKFNIDFLDQCDVKLLCLLGQEVVMTKEDELAIYNLTQGTLKDVTVNAVEDDLVAEMSYIESLVSPYGVSE